MVIGGLVEGKGQLDAVRAVGLLSQQGIDVELTLVGEEFPSYGGRVQEMIASNGLADRVRLVGRVKDASSFLRNADVVLVCSRSEAFGRVTIEAMLAGKAVVGACSGATAELIRDGATGLLYKCSDPMDLAVKVRFLLEHPARLREIARNGQNWAINYFTKERYANAILEVLSSVKRP